MNKKASQNTTVKAIKPTKRLVDILMRLQLVAKHDGQTLEGMLDDYAKQLESQVADEIRGDIVANLR